MKRVQKKSVGILHGNEGPFPYDLRDYINRSRTGSVQAEMASVAYVDIAKPPGYSVIIDRISHCIPFYREVTRHAFLTGSCVINNPYRFHLEKFFGYGVALRIGIKVPRTLLLPSRQWPEHITSRDLENLSYPLDWDTIVQHIGFPAVLKPADGGGWQDVYFVHDGEELMRAYAQSSRRVMMLQQYIRYDRYIRAIVFGKESVLLAHFNPRHKFHPGEAAYIPDSPPLPESTQKALTAQSILLCEALDYDMNSVEWALTGREAYALDFCNQVPDARPEVVTGHYYEWMVEHLGKTAIRYAVNPPSPQYWKGLSRAIGEKRLSKVSNERSEHP